MASLIVCNVSVDVLRIKIFKIGALFSGVDILSGSTIFFSSDIKMNKTVLS